PISMAERSHQNHVGIARIDDNAPDLPRIAQADVLPSSAAVGGFVNAITESDVRAHVGFAGSGINHVRISRRNGQGADGGNTLLLEERLPGLTAIACLPNAAINRAEIVNIGLADDAGHRQRAPAAKWPNRAPAQILKQAGIKWLRRQRSAQ